MSPKNIKIIAISIFLFLLWPNFLIAKYLCTGGSCTSYGSCATFPNGCCSSSCGGSLWCGCEVSSGCYSSDYSGTWYGSCEIVPGFGACAGYYSPCAACGRNELPPNCPSSVNLCSSCSFTVTCSYVDCCSDADCSPSGCCDASCSNYTCVLTPNNSKCPSGQTCNKSCQCVAACRDECSPSGSTQYQCSGNTVQKRTCGNYDADPCLEWSSWSDVENCDNKDGCYSGYYRDYYCSGGSCTYTQSCTESCCDQYYGNSYAYCSGGTCYPPPSYTLNVSKSGSGSGTVTGPGINCGTDCSESYTAGTNVTLTATPASGSYFAGWSGDCSGTGSCTLTMNSNKSVTATFNISNQPPNASFSCNSSQCTGGSGDSSCIMYQPTSDINPCIFTLKNNSTDPDGTISLTKWYIKKKTEPDSSYTEIGSCSGKCDHTIQITDVSDPAIYTVKLSVQDNQGAWASVTRDLTVKREISAGFMCSLDNSNWKPCETIKLFPGQTIFLKDDPSLTEHSVPSEGATINSRTWQRGNGTNFETFAQNTTNASTTLTISQKFIRLIVSDTASRTDRQDHQLSVTYPLPFFREIPPIFFRIRDLLASLISKLGF